MFAFPLEDAGLVDAVGEVFVGFELLEGASGLAGDFLGIGIGALGGSEFGECGFGFGDAKFPAFPVAVFAPGSSGDDMALAVVLDFDEAVGVGEFELGFAGKVFEEGFEGGVGEAGDEFEAFVLEGLEVDFAAHAAIKNEDGVLDLKASAEDFMVLCSVVESARLPRRMEMWSGVPCVSVATARMIWGLSERWSRLCP